MVLLSGGSSFCRGGFILLTSGILSHFICNFVLRNMRPDFGQVAVLRQKLEVLHGKEEKLLIWKRNYIL